MSGLEGAAAGMAAIAARATVVLFLALALAWFARRGSARTLHLLWTTAFSLLLALPALSLLGPSWTVPILPARDVGTRGGSFVMTPEEASAPRTAPEASGLTIPSGSPRRMEGSMASSGSRAVESNLNHPGSGDVSGPPTPSGVAFLIWALGFGAALTSLGVGSLRFRKLVRDSAPVRDRAWRRQTDAIRRRLRVRSQVQVLMSPKVPTPMAGGLWRPVILLPSVAEGWSPERRAVVLAHELVHIRRRDALRQVVGRTVVALYWFHPLSWLAWRAAAIAGERSCDEEVLELGTRPSEYARHLFSLASETMDGPAVPALPMVRRWQLENRIMFILKRHRPRYSLARTSAALAGIGVVGTLIAYANPVPEDAYARPAPQVARDAGHQEFECDRGNGIGVMRRRGEWILQRRVDGMRLCMRNHGNVEMASDGTAIRDMDDDSWLVLESEAERLHRLVIIPGPGGLEYDWSIDGRLEVFDDEAGQWRDLMLTVMDGYLDAREIRGEEAGLRGEIAVHRGHVAALHGEIAAHRGHVATLYGEMATHRGRIAGLRGQVSSRIERDLAARRAELVREMAALEREGMREVEEEIEEYDLARRIAVAETRIEEYNLDGKVRAIESQIAQYDLAGRIAEIEAQIEEYDPDGRIREIEARIEELDADRRIAELERSLDDEIAALRRIIG